MFKALYYIFIGCIIVIALLLVASALPIPGGLKVFVVQSGSMEPAIKTGSVVVVKSAKEYKVGDIVTFGPYSKKKPPTTHRITEVKGNTFVTKGDANDSPDTRTISKRDIVGKVYLAVPYVGYAVAVAKKPWGFVVIIVIPAVIVIYDELRKIILEIKKMKARKKEPLLPPELAPSSFQTKEEKKP